MRYTERGNEGRIEPFQTRREYVLVFELPDWVCRLVRHRRETIVVPVLTVISDGS